MQVSPSESWKMPAGRVSTPLPCSRSWQAAGFASALPPPPSLKEAQRAARISEGYNVHFKTQAVRFRRAEDGFGNSESLVLQTREFLCPHKLPEQGGRNVPVPAASSRDAPLGSGLPTEFFTIPPSASPLLSVARLQRAANPRRL